MITYINYIDSVRTRSYGIFYYTTFSNGIKVEEAVKKMTTESEHTKNSSIKTVIDNWYKDNMMAYTEKLEDTTWCNDRTVSYYGSWSKDGNLGSLVYNNYVENKPFTCQNKNDAYTVNDTINGNGDLEYPVGLLTYSEALYAGTDVGFDTTTYLSGIDGFWPASPARFSKNQNYVYFVNSGGYMDCLASSARDGVRPSVSLAPGTISMEGDGSPEDPFIVE